MFESTSEFSEALEKEKGRLLKVLEKAEVDSEEYQKAMRTYADLQRLQTEEKPKWPISPETMLIVGGNLLGVLMILKYEHANILTSKALGMLNKPRQP